MADNLPDLNISEVDKIIESFKDIYQATTKLISARVQKIPNHQNNIIISEWSQRNLERQKSMKIMRYMLSDSNFKSCVDIDIVDVSHWILNAISKSGKYRAVICGVPDEESKLEMKYYLEMWSEKRLILTFDLTALAVHGDIYTECAFTSISWASQENRVIYIAEQIKPKNSPFYEQMTINKSSNDSKIIGRGEQFIYEETWGENIAPKQNPVIVSCDIGKKTITILQGVPKDVSPGQTICDPNGKGIVGVGYLNKPRKLGLFGSTNRKNHIFYLSYEGEYSILSDEQVSVHSPKFSPDGKYLVWFQRLHSGPHDNTHSLVRWDWNAKLVISIIDVVQESITTENNKQFYGIYGPELTRENFGLRCWTSDSRYFLFATTQKYCIRTFAVNIEKGKIWDISYGNEDESTILLDVSDDNYALFNITSYNQSSVLTSLHIPSFIKNNSKESLFVSLTKPAIFDNKIMISNFTVHGSDEAGAGSDCFATYFGPRKNSNKPSTPVIIYLHGGPHWRVSNVFSPMFNVFVKSGFGVLIPHFRGSAGLGQKYIESLIGKIGSLEVYDCYNSLRTAIRKFPWLDPNQVVLYGGSSGGFIAAHLCSQNPNEIRGVVMRSPVTDAYLRCFLTDIPDWTSVHLGLPFNGLTDIVTSPEIYNKMIGISPVKNIKHIKAPTLLLLGKKDLRVPPSIGLTYHHMLKERNVITKVLFYEDNHQLTNNVSSEMDSIINSVIWFRRCLKQNA